MNFKIFLIILFLTRPFGANAQKKTSPIPKKTTLQRPKLVVGIVIDQMRWDYLYRFYNRYAAGGFKRLLNEGFSCENVDIDYIPTFTAVGHASIYTGSVPAIHGIVGNDFIVQTTGKSMYCTEDTTVQTVGSTSAAGQMSPRNLLTTTIADELRLATNFQSKVIGIALKDRGGILPTGHTANAAYWFDDLTGNWISSTYYMKDLPTWVKQVNAARLVENYLKLDWQTLYPISTYTQSFPDNNPYEGRLAKMISPTLPIYTSEPYSKNFNNIRYSPYGNSLTLDMAKATLDHERLGKNYTTDFLAISLSATDYIGHIFGPNSVEVEDTYLRLDQDLASFFKYLDQTIGKGQYTIFLTADHGAAHNAKLLSDKNIPSGFFNGNQVLKDLNIFLQKKYNIPLLVLSGTNYQVNLDEKLVSKNNLNETDILIDCINFLKNQTGIAYAVNMNNIQAASIPEALRSRIENGYHAERSGVVQVILRPGWYQGYGTFNTGTTHGTWNPYDTHIPLLFMGWGIKKGKVTKPYNMTDITPTISALLRIQVPSGSIGKVITEVLK